MSATNQPVSRKPGVLVLEDEANWQRDLAAIFRAEGFDVDTATDSAHAILLIDQKPYDLVTIDVGLPANARTGWEQTAQRIRDRRPSTLILIVTGDTKLETAINAINNYRAAAYFTKENFTSA